MLTWFTVVWLLCRISNSSATPASYSNPTVLKSGHEFGIAQICPAGHFAVGTCASGETSKCNKEQDGYSTSCVQDDNFKQAADIRWLFAEEGEWINCGEGAILGLCSSGNRAQCYSRDNLGILSVHSHGLLCSKPTLETDTKVYNDYDADCYHMCGEEGSDVNCAEGFALHEFCSSFTNGICDNDARCPGEESVMFGATCCKIDPNAIRTIRDNSVLIAAVTAVSGACIGAGVVVLVRRSSRNSQQFQKNGLSPVSNSIVKTNKSSFSDLMNLETRPENGLKITNSKKANGFVASASSLLKWNGTKPSSTVDSENGDTQSIVDYLSRTTHSELFIDPDDLEIGSLLSKGGEGQVFRGRFAGSTVAVKEILNSADKLSDAFRREFESLRLIQHPHIIRLFGICAKKSIDTGMTRYLIVMEMAKCSLRKVLRDRTQVDYAQALDLAYQTCVGIAFIHSQNMLHLDIKPENILLSPSGSVKICDLGLATIATSRSSVGHQQKTVTGHGVTGTPAYISPERVQDFQNVAAGAKRHVSSASDVYSFGIVFWELCHLERAFPRDWDGYKIIAEVKVRNYRPTISPDCPQDLADVMRSCWIRNPQKRPTSAMLKSRFRTLLQRYTKSNRRSEIVSNFSRLFSRSEQNGAAPFRLSNTRRKPGIERNPELEWVDV